MTYAKTDLFSKKQRMLSDIAKALSHPARIAILEYLADQDACMSGDITRKIPLNRTTASQHLQELKNAGLIKGTVSGTRIYYCIDTANVEKMKKEFCDLMEHITSNKSSCRINNGRSDNGNKTEK
jgi:DNA-binding transcriptional ArsR family regulator